MLESFLELHLLDLILFSKNIFNNENGQNEELNFFEVYFFSAMLDNSPKRKTW